MWKFCRLICNYYIVNLYEHDKYVTKKSLHFQRINTSLLFLFSVYQFRFFILLTSENIQMLYSDIAYSCWM